MSAELRASIKQGVTTLCTCISIRRRDGRSFYFTDHDVEVELDGVKHSPMNSFSRTSVTTSSELEVDSMEIRGILNSEAVGRTDVASGLFDFAEVSVYVVNYENPEYGPAKLRTGWMGEVVMNEDGTFEAEVRGLTQVLTYRIGEAYAPECRANLGDSRCKVPLVPARWQPTTGYNRETAVLGVINAASNFHNLSFVNASFDDQAGDDPTTTLTGWVSEGDSGGRWAFTSTANGVQGPKSGSVFLYHTNGDNQESSRRVASQIIDLAASAVDMDAIETGLSRLSAGVWAVCLSNIGLCGLAVHAISASGASTVLFDSGPRKYAEDKWFRIDAPTLNIPASTTKLKFVLSTSKKHDHEFGGGFDLISAAINYPNGDYGSNDQFGGVCFVATNTGYSGATEPTFSNALGALTTDGTVVWKTVPAYSTSAEVRAPAADNRSFVPKTLANPDGWFDGGLVTWETGLNAGRTQEIKTWKAGRLTLFQRPYFPIKPTDTCVLRPGCDKRRVTCGGKFDNVINFRGEPDVPGQDEYYKTPNSSSAD